MTAHQAADGRPGSPWAGALAVLRAGSRTGQAAIRRLPVGASLAGATVPLLVAVGASSIVAGPIGQLLPINPDSVDPLDAISSAIALVALAIGLARGKRLAWYLGLAAFGSALIVQLVVLGHAIAGLICVGCLISLVGDRSRHRAPTERATVGLIAFAVGLGAALTIGEAVLINQVTGHSRDVLDTVAGFLAFYDPAGVGTTAETLVIDSLELLTRALLAFAVIAILRAVGGTRLGPIDRIRAMDVARLKATSSLSPFQLADTIEPFLGPDGDGLLMYGHAGRFDVVLGDPIGSPESAALALRAFVERCRAADRIPIVYQGSPELRSVLVEVGFRPFCVGREAIVELSTFSLDGSRRANLRHTVTRARRAGVQIDWLPLGSAGADLARRLPGLEEVDREWRRNAGPELGFTISRFAPDDLAGVALAIANDRDGRTIAFATFRRTGSASVWVLDLMRRVPGTTPGALEACLAVAAAALRDSGAASLSLGLVPLSGLDRRSSIVPERLLAYGVGIIRPWYDVEGLAFFKNKFDPRWEDRYGATLSLRHLPGYAVTLLRLHLAGQGGSLRRAGQSVIAAARSVGRG